MLIWKFILYDFGKQRRYVNIYDLLVQLWHTPSWRGLPYGKLADQVPHLQGVCQHKGPRLDNH